MDKSLDIPHSPVEKRKKSQDSSAGIESSLSTNQSEDPLDIADEEYLDEYLEDQDENLVPNVLDSGVYEEEENTVTFTATVFTRNFKGQKKGPIAGNLLINCSSPETVMNDIWNYCKKYIRREAVFEPIAEADAENYAVHWHENEKQSIKHIDKFITLQDKVSKKLYKPSQLLEKPDKLQKLFKKEINIMVYIYSDSVTSSSMYDVLRAKLLKPEERDRAGAASNQSICAMVEELKNLHQSLYEAAEINWAVWASYLMSKDIFKRDELKKRGPPNHLVHLFQTVPSCAQRLLTNTRKDIRIAQNVNDGFKDQLQALQKDLHHLTAYAKSMQIRLEALCAIQVRNDSLLTDVSASINTVDDDYTAEIAQQVDDCFDVDHE